MNPKKVSENLRFFNVFFARKTFAMGPRMAQALKKQENYMLFVCFYAKINKTIWFCLLFSAPIDDLAGPARLGSARLRPGSARPGPALLGSAPPREPGEPGEVVAGGTQK